jgi:hypothetical protein
MKHAIVATLALLLFSATELQAAEIKAMFPAVMKSVMTELPACLNWGPKGDKNRGGQLLVPLR